MLFVTFAQKSRFPTLKDRYSYRQAERSQIPRCFLNTPGIGRWVTLALLRGAIALLSARYQSGAVAMSDNNLPLPVSKFATVDMGGMLPVRAGLSVQAGVKNLLDRNYFYWAGFPEEGRNWYLTLRCTF
jgi:iron complex outermembrane receptor protein